MFKLKFYKTLDILQRLYKREKVYYLLYKLYNKDFLVKSDITSLKKMLYTMCGFI